jgi:two-component sensor histidine kinase
VKNVLATVNSIITQTQRGPTSYAEFLICLDARILSLARTHELLSSTSWNGVELAKIVERELAPFSANHCEVGGPDVTLRAEAVQSVAMVFHELGTNAAKYGAFTRSTGHLSLQWWVESGRLIIEWREGGGPGVVPPGELGYGATLIRELIPFELGGTVDLAFAADGIKCLMEIPEVWVS